MTQEEKAKRYDEAIERAESIYNETAIPSTTTKGICTYIFPELKEREDEKIREKLIDYIKSELDDVRHIAAQNHIEGGYEDEENILKEYIAWLEKQGEHQNFIDRIQIGDQVTRNEDGILVNLSQLKRVAKPVDKVEPKFKVGDWIVSDDKDVHDDYRVCKITKINDGRYYIEDGGFLSESTLAQYEYRLWTIQDAKDGDVLVYGDNPNDHHVEVIMIFKSLRNEKSSFNHFHIFDDKFRIDDWSDCGKNVHPATKEQRDLLFQKMKEAGYEWDAEKKELKKIENEIEIPFGAKDSELEEGFYSIPNGFHAEIEDDKVVIKKGEQKPAWSEEDEEYINDLIGVFDGQQYQAHSDEEIVKWLKSIRLPYNKEWDENDEEMLRSIIATCELAEQDRDSSPARHLLEMQLNWLKSLRPQNTWKPSDEQIRPLEYAIDYFRKKKNDTTYLESLYQDLKKLMEE